MPRKRSKELKICIGPYVYRQRWTDAEFLEQQGAAALCIMGAREIHLLSELDHASTFECLIHEVIEAINAEKDLGLEHYQIQDLGFLLNQALAPILKKWW